jgi:hypothetical protein
MTIEAYTTPNGSSRDDKLDVYYTDADRRGIAHPMWVPTEVVTEASPVLEEVKPVVWEGSES